MKLTYTQMQKLYRVLCNSVGTVSVTPTEVRELQAHFREKLKRRANRVQPHGPIAPEAAVAKAEMLGLTRVKREGETSGPTPTAETVAAAEKQIADLQHRLQKTLALAQKQHSESQHYWVQFQHQVQSACWEPTGMAFKAYTTQCVEHFQAVRAADPQNLCIAAGMKIATPTPTSPSPK